MERGRCQSLDQEGPMCSSPDRKLLWGIFSKYGLANGKCHEDSEHWVQFLDHLIVSPIPPTGIPRSMMDMFKLWLPFARKMHFVKQADL